ncbi:hypothetical protein [Paraburkholderia hospita]|uniref:hypothetical protein n=1 Tax=Paraburkholderia hospita TaxID=169430 RepID=UPI00058806F4|nr:hypothetical protein [Paraburkholderia hospita]
MHLNFSTVKLVQRIDGALLAWIRQLGRAACVALLLGTIVCPQRVFAGGGLDSATQGVNTFRIWLYTFLGVCASCVLLWKGAECWADRAHWSEFITLGGKVAVVGAVVGVLAPYLWNLFS